MTTLKHSPTLETIRQLVDYQIKTDRYRYRLFDFNGFTPAEMRASEVRRLADYDRAYPEESYSAIIADDALLFGIERMFETYRDRSGYSRVRVFNDKENGLTWLKLLQANNS
jgi:hypothetical protein